VKYALLIYEKPGAYEALSAAEREAITGEYLAIRAEEPVVGGGHLLPASTATTVRVADGTALITDGPFADTKEVFGGYFIVEAPDLDVALEIAERIPAARLGGSVEIRPMVHS
jgi:hypothetical protein